MYDDTFADALAVSFRPTKAIRAFELAPACAGSPSLQPRILAQDNLARGEECTLELDLPAGAYRLRAMPPRDSASLRIRDDVDASEVDVGVSAGGCSPSYSTLGSGPVKLTVRNTGPRAATFVLERRQVPDEVLTAGRVLESPRLLDRLPRGAVESEITVGTKDLFLAVVEAVGSGPSLGQWAAASGARRSGVRDGRLVAEFGSFPAMMEALARVHGDETLRGGALAGPVVPLDGGPRRVYLGTGIERLLGLVASAEPGDVVINEPGGVLANLLRVSWEQTERGVSIGRFRGAVVQPSA